VRSERSGNYLDRRQTPNSRRSVEEPSLIHLKPIFELSGSLRVVSVNAFEVGESLLVTGGIRDDGFTAGEIGELEADFEKASDTAPRAP